MALFCIFPQSPPRKLSIITAISRPCPPFTAVCEETSTVIFEEEKSLIVEHDFWGENSFVFGVFG